MMQGLIKLRCALYQRIIQFNLNIRQDNGKVLMFHIINSCKDFWEDSNISITQETFEKYIEILSKEYKFCELHQLGQKTEYKQIYITFDDAYDDVYNVAYPLLKKRNIPFTVFITGDFIDKKRYLTRKMISALIKEPLCTIGFHSKTHSLMKYLSNDDFVYEMTKSRKDFEVCIGKKVHYFAFPYGSTYAVSNKNIKYAKGCFKYVFLTWNAHINTKYIKKKRTIPRINVNETLARRYINEAFS